MKFSYPSASTPLDLDEINGLIPKHIETQAELNEWEQSNILEAAHWLRARHPAVSDILDTQFIRSFIRGCSGKLGVG